MKDRKGFGGYLRKKGSTPYAIMFILNRETQIEEEFILKQDIIVATKASGISKMHIRPLKSGVPPGKLGTNSSNSIVG